MADYCKQCSEELFGKDYHDFSGLFEDPKAAILVMCEGCGPIQVNIDGECVSSDCLKPGHNKPFPSEGA